MFSSTTIHIDCTLELVRMLHAIRGNGRRRMNEILLRLCLLVSYALAGSQAFATLFHVK